MIAVLWAKVDASAGADGCWPFRGTILQSGYGQIKVDGRRWRAHRLAYRLTYGPIPDGLLVCHTCDNRRCCRPTHLWLGTNGDNMHDAMAKGRWSPHVAGNRDKTHCIHGHPYDEANTYLTARGTRACRACRSRYKQQRRERQRVAT